VISRPVPTADHGWAHRRVPRSSVLRSRRLALLLALPLLVGMIGAPSASPVRGDELADAKARQAQLQAQIAKQKAEAQQINALQADLKSQIASTNKALASVNADLKAVRRKINGMVVQIQKVQAEYDLLVAELARLADQLEAIQYQEARKRAELAENKAVLAERIRAAYDTNRTSFLETLLSGASFTDVLAEVSYQLDAGEEDRQLAVRIAKDQETLAALHQTVEATRVQTDQLREETAKHKVELDQQLAQLKAAQAELKRLEAETKKALAIQRAAYAKLAKNKKDLAKAIATTSAAQRALAAKIDDLVQQQLSQGNIPSLYNGTLRWPMAGSVTNEFGCSSYPLYAPGNGCAHFHNGIDIVAPGGCGTPIKAAGDGRVGYIGWNYADGADPAWIVIIVHSQNLQTWYAHMKANTYPGGIHPGSAVDKGQLIGFEGNTGRSTGCHLHWMVEQNGTFKNPRYFV
jgi:murein DD-endopeptidase MepM/ murein hydrolase activator NlpD